jgi:hypothetical protein
VPIRDQREIAFDAAAMVAVIACSTQAAQTVGLPGGLPRGARFDAKAGTVVLLYGVGERGVPVGSGALGALLISYCLRSGIKIPRHLERHIRVDQDALVLMFRANYPVPPANIAPEQPNRKNAGAAPHAPMAATGIDR